MSAEKFKAQLAELERICESLRPGTGAGIATLCNGAYEEGLAAGRELAAKIAESEKVDAEATKLDEDYAYNRACDDIAEAIRKEQP